MGHPPRTPVHLTIVVLVVLASLLAACTGDDTSPAGAEGPPTTSPPPVTSAESYVFTDAAGIEARLTLEGDGAMLTVENDTGAALPRPGVYVLDARDGSRIDWTVVDARAASKGESEWQVERPPVPEAKHIGLVVLLFGGEDYGAFVPPQPGGAA
ncbi:MAG: hypothetical protein OEV60_04630 [Actinomycetota bacterium]|nr:hypothetical protein [Actinomycetota bacterium]MDH5224340.1 hypothetical protein [Actinomycetota bacterium]MDH5312497.1 hypothetical protein [Actinomycetota bacterium]